MKTVGDQLRQRIPSADEEQAALGRVWSSVERSGGRVPDEVLRHVDRIAVVGRPFTGRRLMAAAILVVAVGTAVLWPRSEALYRIVEGVLVLIDGSRVEVRPDTELTVERADDGLRIRLDRGGIIVHAAEQRTGHLYVQTMDMTVSVVGTVFLVNATDEGSRVAVIEGEVRVLQGATEQTLLPGQQIATALVDQRLVSDAIAWSRNAPALVALLQQSAAVPPAVAPQNAAASLVFEVASVRRSDRAPSGGRGGQDARHFTGPCTNGATQLDPRRFVAANNTLYTLITLAYGMGSCLATFDRVSGGPAWITSDRFDIEALIPEGGASYTPQQFNTGAAPEMQAMLRTLLEDRFGLAVHRETKEMAVYLLEVADGAPRLPRWGDGGGPAPGTSGARAVMAAPGYIEGQKASLADLLSQLTMVTGRPVVDRTGLTGEFNYAFQFAPLDSNFFVVPPNPAAATRPSLFTVLREKYGLRLEAGRAPVDVLVVDRVERPNQDTRDRFEVVSIRPAGPVVVPGARGGGGGAQSRPTKDGCVPSSVAQLDPGRVSIRRATLFQLIAHAYPGQGVPTALGDACDLASRTGLISGGPEWIKTEVWDLEATIPGGIFSAPPTLTDPRLQQMLAASLADRFNLVLRRDAREIPVYLLKVGQGGPRFNGLPEVPAGRPQPLFLGPDGNAVPLSQAQPPPDGEIRITGGSLLARNVSMAKWADHLFGLDGRPVLDRTGLTGRYDFHFNDPAGRPRTPGVLPDTGALRRSVLRAVGLELETARAPFDVWVIERAERPSDN